ncbi:hypothetical protein Hanom_Chr15g01406541 [Helianthus anomalus]
MDQLKGDPHGGSAYIIKINVMGGPKPSPRWAGAPPEKKISAKFRRKSHPHPLDFFVRTPWNFSTAPLKFFVRTP